MTPMAIARVGNPGTPVMLRASSSDIGRGEPPLIIARDRFNEYFPPRLFRETKMSAKANLRISCVGEVYGGTGGI